MIDCTVNPILIRQKLQERLDFASGDVLKPEYLPRIDIEDDDEYNTRVSHLTYPPYQVQKLINYFVHQVFKQDIDRSEIKSIEPFMVFVTSEGDVVDDLEVFWRRFLQGYLAYGGSNFLLTVSNGSRYTLYEIPALVVYGGYNQIDGSFNFEYPLVNDKDKIKVQRDGDGWRLIVNDFEQVTSFRPLLELAIDHNLNGVPDHILDPAIRMSRTLLNLSSVLNGAFFNESITTVGIPMTETMYQMVSDQWTVMVGQEKKIVPKLKKVMITSGEGKIETINRGGEWHSLIMKQIKDLQDNITDSVNQHVTTLANQSGVAKAIDSENQSIPLHFLATLMEDFESTLYSILFNDKVRKVYYDKNFNVHTREQTANQLLDLLSVTTNDGMRLELEIELVKLNMLPLGWTSEQVEAIYGKRRTDPDTGTNAGTNAGTNPDTGTNVGTNT